MIKHLHPLKIKQALLTLIINRYKLILVVVFSTLILSACSQEPETKEITVYSSRAEHLIKPLFDKFTAETGIKVRYSTDKAAALIAKLKAEGDRTQADALLTVDAGNLWYAKEQGLLRAISNSVVEQNVPSYLRASDLSWVGLSVRARTIVFNTNNVSADDLDSYEDLAQAKWQGRLCLRTSKKVYNQSLVSAMAAATGEQATAAIVTGWVNNLAIAPLSSDTKALEAVAAGVCDVTIVNTYYLGRLMEKQPELPLQLHWANQQDRGVHVNVSGMGVTRFAKEPELAEQLLQWLTSETAQKDFAGLNKEYPVNANVVPVPQLLSWGEFKQDQLQLDQVGRGQQQAIKLMDKAGYK